MSMAAHTTPVPTEGLPLADRIVAIASMRGSVGITQDELLRKLGVAYEEMMAALDPLCVAHWVRVHWSSAESFRVFYTG